jgi:hypothetical protein
VAMTRQNVTKDRATVWKYEMALGYNESILDFSPQLKVRQAACFCSLLSSGLCFSCA